MPEHLSQEQLAKLVAEVDRLALARQQTLDPEQVREILQELNLPTDLYEEATLQIQRREALAAQQRRYRRIAIAAIATILLVGLAGFGLMQYQQQQLAQVSVQQARLTLAQADSASLTVVNRQTSPELWYRVVLQDAPVGQRLPLSCDWMNPSGQVVKQNRYDTQMVKTPVWPTHCRYQIPANGAPGQWTVEMKLRDRSLGKTPFQVK